MTTIDSQYLRVFCALARQLNMSRAAQELELTPSAISHCLKALEADLGCRLFERSSRRISITPAGREFRVEAEGILEKMSTARTKLRTWVEWRRGGLQIAATPSACRYLVPLVLREFRESFPDLSIQIKACSEQQASELVSAEEVDLALTVEPLNAVGMRFIPLATDELHFFVHPLHPWLKRGVERDPTQCNLILPERTSETHSLIQTYFGHESVRIKAALEIGDEEAIKHSVRLNLGVGFLPRWIATEEVASGLLASLPLGRRRLRRQWGILHNSHRKLTLPESVFVDFCGSVTAGIMNATDAEEAKR